MEVYSVMVTSTLSWLVAARLPEQQRPKQDLVNTNICRRRRGQCQPLQSLTHKQRRRARTQP